MNSRERVSQLTHKKRLSNTSFVRRPLTIPLHRSIRREDIKYRNLLEILLIPVLFSILVHALLPYTTEIYRQLYLFWIDKLDLGAIVHTTNLQFLTIQADFPIILLSNAATIEQAWLPLTIATSTVLLISFFISSTFLPLLYFLRVAAIVQLLAIATITGLPDVFPHSTDSHIELINTSYIALLFIIPWIHSVVYNIFDYRLYQKLLLTFLTLAYILIFTPFTVLMHSYLLAHFSVLIMPLLYFFLGLLVPIMGSIAIYGWAMSWKR